MTSLHHGDLKWRSGRQKSLFSSYVWLHRMLSAVRVPSVTHSAALDRGKLVTLIAGSNKLCRLLFVGDR